jgi:hypothetical protein
MLTFQHSFSTRIFLNATSTHGQHPRSVILSRAKDPREHRDSAWILRSAQDDREKKTLSAAKRGGAHAR